MINKTILYRSAVIRTIEETKEDFSHQCLLNDYNMEKVHINKDLTKKYIFYAIKLFNEMDEPVSYDKVEESLQLSSMIHSKVSLLTPKEFMTVFPIDKYYNGHKAKLLNYFYTMEYIKTLKQDQPIGENVYSYLMEYFNKEIRSFNNKNLKAIRRINRLEGKIDDSGNIIPQYTKISDSKGNGFLLDKTGSVRKVPKKRPSHLKLVK